MSASTPRPTQSNSKPAGRISHDRLCLSAMRVAVVAPFMAKQDPRHYLNGINVRPHPEGGAVICATNGTIMGAVHDKFAVCDQEVTLQLHPSIVIACRAHHSDRRQLVMFKGRLAVTEGDQEICIQPGDPVITGDAFPRYERVIPSEAALRPGLKGNFQVRLLATLQDAIKVVNSGKRAYAPIYFFHVDGDANCVGVARSACLDEFVAVVLPVHDQAPDSSTPAWVKAAQLASSPSLAKAAA